ncbi:flagellar basal body-associated protein FliL [Pseudomonas sp. gcc21]|uniref:flagellar basal body-associated FliL family protein n=1 Tax=Pseudomonas sp. gcc21 TaxID=2726989 RepID=UPI0014527F86|nr:flagellar basal body-associated FliL family protein [Pseudomonas sp. gcc21]QJD58828.1 flagellar basal body-associated protein FliL [Pseudomonas sp. gcc21]
MARQQPEPAQPATPESPPASRKKLLLLVGAGLFALLLSIGAAAFFLFASEDETVAETPVVEAGKPMAIYQSLDPAFVVNYVHEGRQRYMQVNVVLMGRDPQLMTQLSSHLPLIRNELVMLFSSEEFDALFSPEGKEALRERASLAVKALMEKELGNPIIESALFTNIVLQ